MSTQLMIYVLTLYAYAVTPHQVLTQALIFGRIKRGRRHQLRMMFINVDNPYAWVSYKVRNDESRMHGIYHTLDHARSAIGRASRNQLPI